MYTAEGKEFIGTDVTSLKHVMDVARKQWVWIDIYNPDKEESQIILKLFGTEKEEALQIEKQVGKPLTLRKGCLLCDYETFHDCVCLTVPSISMEENFQSHPIALVKKDEMLITWGEEDGEQSTLIKLTIRRLRELVEEGEKPNSALALSMLLREIAINNSEVLLSVREKIDLIEEQTMENGDKKLIHSIFSLKKILSTLYRSMINEKEFMLDVDTKIIPHIRLDKKAKSIVEEAIDIIEGELESIDFYTRTLDSLLTLQDLASIHKVESSINFLTIVLVISTIILVLLEILGALGVT
jgi:Mg2+ and Co2+ transporter CorA